jgi:uncharacterized protein (DUF2062 family)
LLGDANNYQLPEQLSMHYIIDSPWSVIWPMTVGGVPTGVVAWFAFFWPVRALVLQYQHRRRRRLRRRAMKIKRREGARLYADR